MTRTKTSHTKNVCIRFQPGDIERLHRLSAATGLEVSSLVRMLLATAEATGLPAIRFGTDVRGEDTEHGTKPNAFL